MRRLALILVVVVTAAACGGSTSAPTAIATPAATITTDTFTGTLNPPANNVFDIKTHTFTVTTAGGNINITLLSAGPPATIKLGLALGNPSSTGVCALIQGFVIETAAGSTAQIPASGAPAGAYCVAVGDTGN